MQQWVSYWYRCGQFNWWRKPGKKQPTCRKSLIYNYGPLCRETSIFVNLRGEVVFPRACPMENNRRGLRAVSVLLYFCQCFIGYPLVGKNWVVRRGTIGLFPGSANFGKTSQLFYYHMTNLIQSKSIIYIKI